MKNVAYDLDGVLCAPMPFPPKKWGLMKGHERVAWKEQLLELYRTAEKLLDPDEARFHVITARKDDPRVVTATLGWLRLTFGERLRGVRFLQESRSLQNVVPYKARTIQDLHIEEFTEDNLQVVRGLNRLGVGCKVFLFRDGERTLHY